VATSTTPMTEQPKQGGKCCGSCCDYRRAVIILSAISILFTIIGLVQGPRDVEVEDDDLAQDLEAIQDEYKTGNLVLSIFSLLMALVSLVGALQFNQHLVRKKQKHYSPRNNCAPRTISSFSKPNHSSFPTTHAYIYIIGWLERALCANQFYRCRRVRFQGNQ
jgi:hypothetical protein